MKSKCRQLSLKIFPDDVLRQICTPVENFDAELNDFAHEMMNMMRIHEGIGLAAPQVGWTKRLFVCEIENDSLILVNPDIIHADGQHEMIEGCLSLPGIQVNVTRKDRLLVRGFDVYGRKVQYGLTGLWARVVQHETDHLNGVLICDHGDNLQVEKPLGNEDKSGERQNCSISPKN